MRKLAAAAFLLVAGTELIAIATRDRQLILIVTGGALALALLGVRWQLAREDETSYEATPSDDAAESLLRWRSRTETLISRAEATRKDWDRHLRPMLARQFELATGQRRNRNRTAYHATGEMLFGPELWEWVNPENVVKSVADQPGPGRATLDEILQRLERV
ncbi:MULTISPECIES: hypothetical protein [unclassified Mycobacterium]|uniref:hypothetical protein n=1 Tax=unclassified Mycobacterium TaxID=2642494 RepID=UPI0007403205|nr:MULTISPECIES: hypothetical protein [unclassified Mycobacterium]KUH85427.1 hypothetical protein AU186_21905 [Mycobacterium sp. GA-1999]KUH91287.1 hypothetical protein AU185_08970 [Mycobacterium sp. GA-0227b]KUH96458.1 hypothetical protein AU187_14875 [Mycobacterium sp. IS-1556]